MNSEEKVKKMEALVSLIDEPDPAVFADISRSIEEYGYEIIPILENAWETQHVPEMQQRLEDLVHTIQYQKVCDDLMQWIENGANDLLQGCLIIARYQYPNLREEEIEYELSLLRKDVWLEMNDNLTALEQIKVFNYVFYDAHSFKGNVTNYHAPENSYINKVLEQKTGNPLSLSIIYLLIAQSLDLPVKGVNLPEHFVLAYTGASIDPDTHEFKGNNILFYINVFSRGTVFSHRDIDNFLKQLNQQSKPAYFNPCNNIDIIMRMINNLTIAYQKLNETSKLNEIKYLAQLVEKQRQKQVKPE